MTLMQSVHHVSPIRYAARARTGVVRYAILQVQVFFSSCLPAFKRSDESVPSSYERVPPTVYFNLASSGHPSYVHVHERTLHLRVRAYLLPRAMHV